MSRLLSLLDRVAVLLPSILLGMVLWAVLRALAEAVPPDVVVCGVADCDRIAVSPAEGLPEGWDGMWSRHVGWAFTCPHHLDAIEEDWRSGRSAALGGGQTR